MTVRIAINGFGRIGRLVLRAVAESQRNDLEVVAINNRSEPDMAAHLFKYDSVHGTFQGAVSTTSDSIDIGAGPIAYCREEKPADLPWAKHGVDVVLECTGKFRTRDQVQAHLDAGAGKVLISAPGKGSDLTVVYGVNHRDIEPGNTVVSNASCTTNCLAPVAMVLNDLCGIERGFMTTIHAYTTDQRLLDNSHKSDLRRARAAGMSMIPTSTGAAKSIGDVLPALKGKLDGTSIRVPTPNVSLVDLVFLPGRTVTVEEINAAMAEAARGPLKGVLDICTEPLVSIDFNHNPASATFDAGQTQVVDGGLVRIGAWYDNEWGFSHRMNDTAAYMGGL
ncbi:type I glyceraldehyde-3-phosphate dehydrogenase [Kaustia mangrovi]|uniref:Glyceraldehyde-3-phosphate dehydrogenase n=1 Tax=Kaustia mangrovi TaxID=2593653 RepID=A0A7S8C5T4_9HYPH|nr:type I glyceraldehyde-3-phosphate dehydrogenase [Kaustia mangrovi]QPC43931.1 type I glyceraldehyde-3-phosphate dehydrogenase [Kaustia mangrovi]